VARESSKTAPAAGGRQDVTSSQEPILRLDEEDGAEVAYRRWLDRGCPQGSPEEDWFEAERQIRAQIGQS
jgi:hypothetical protein